MRGTSLWETFGGAIRWASLTMTNSRKNKKRLETRRQMGYGGAPRRGPLYATAVAAKSAKEDEDMRDSGNNGE